MRRGGPGELEALLARGAAEGVYSAGAGALGLDGREVFAAHAGRHAPDPASPAASPDSLFDLASLTKPLATLPCLLLLHRRGALDLFAPLGGRLAMPPDKAGLTAADLLCHAGGLPAWRPFHQEAARLPWAARAARILELTLAEPLESRPGERTVYSDLGFVILHALVEEAAQTNLAEFFWENVSGPLGLERELGFVALPDGPGPAAPRFVASENCPWRGRLLVGEVSDDNAWAAGGVAGQAGLFGTLRGVLGLADWLLGLADGRPAPRHGPDLDHQTARLLHRRPHGARTLGFDVADPARSSAGKLAGPGVVGHLGFTGTSLWHDPARRLTAVLLTNRVVMGRDNQKIVEFRMAWHDAAARALGLDPGGAGPAPATANTEEKLP